MGAHDDPRRESETPEQPPQTADPHVQLAFRLGWHMAELYGSKLSVKRSNEPNERETLPGTSALDDHERAEVVLQEIRTELHLLGEACRPAAVELRSSKRLEDRFRAGDRARDEVRLLILELHTSLLRDLTAADFRLGKAYGLGRALADTMLRPSSGDLPAYDAEFRAERIRTLCKWLDDLSSSFPRHAAPAVRFGLGEWSKWVLEPEVDGRRAYLENGGRKLTLAVHGQGRLWRGLLSGEKRPEDLLAPKDYVEAAHRMVGQAGFLVRECLREWIGVIVMALLALGLLLAAIFKFLDGNPQGAATLAAIVAGLGLSWKALGATLGKGLSRLEQPLWRAELAESVSIAATRLPRADDFDKQPSAPPPKAATAPAARPGT